MWEIGRDNGVNDVVPGESLAVSAVFPLFWNSKPHVLYVGVPMIYDNVRNFSVRITTMKNSVSSAGIVLSSNYISVRVA